MMEYLLECLCVCVHVVQEKVIKRGGNQIEMKALYDCRRDEWKEMKGSGLLCVAESGRRKRGRGRMCVSEGPSLLCAGVRGEGRGLWWGLVAAVFSIQTLPTHRTCVMLHGGEREQDRERQH